MNKRINIKCRKNKRQCRTLPHTYIYIIDFREKQVPRILDRSTYKIIRKKVNNTVCKAKVSENWSKHTVIQRRKELCNIKSNNTSFESLGPASSYQIDQKHTSILNRPLDCWLEWRIPYLTVSNWSHLAIIFSISLLRVLNRTIGLKALEIL